MEVPQLTPLRFGIMVDDLSLEAWKVETVRKLVEGGILIGLAYAFSFMQYSGNWLQGGSISLEVRK